MDTSPTGLPVLPSWLPKIAFAVVGLAALVKPLLPAHHTIAGSICDLLLGFGATLGIASQGVRKVPVA